MVAVGTKGRITGLIAIPFLTDVALQPGDHVHIVGPYKVVLADGTKPCVGWVSVNNVKRTVTATASTYPVADTPGGKVTVEVRGIAVETRLAGAAITAGTRIGVGAAGALLTVAAGVVPIGIALTTTTAAAQEIDILVTTEPA